MQCFLSKDKIHIFNSDQLPKLLYVSEALHELSKLPFATHMHEDFVEIIYVKDGKGIQVVDGKEYVTQKGDILIYNSRTLHKEKAHPDTGMSVYSCGVTNLQLEGLRQNCLIPDGTKPIFQCGEYADEIESLFKIMYSHIYKGNDGAEEICINLVSALLNIIVRNLIKNDDTIATDDNIAGNRIKQYIDENYYKDLTLDSISKALYISESYLCHAFKETTGSTPIQYITNRRVGTAQILLITTDLSATEIAAKVGYENSNYFNSIFTKSVGMSPIKYRKRWKKYNDTEENKQ